MSTFPRILGHVFRAAGLLLCVLLLAVWVAGDFASPTLQLGNGPQTYFVVAEQGRVELSRFTDETATKHGWQARSFSRRPLPQVLLSGASRLGASAVSGASGSVGFSQETVLRIRIWILLTAAAIPTLVLLYRGLRAWRPLWFAVNVRRRMLRLPAWVLVVLAGAAIRLCGLVPPFQVGASGRTYGTVVLGLRQGHWSPTSLIAEPTAFDRVVVVSAYERWVCGVPEVVAWAGFGPLRASYSVTHEGSFEAYPLAHRTLATPEFDALRPVVAQALAERHADAAAVRRLRRAAPEHEWFWPNLAPNAARAAQLLAVGLIIAALIRMTITTPGERRAIAAGLGRCPRCGYPLAGLASARCPECGWIGVPA